MPKSGALRTPFEKIHLYNVVQYREQKEVGWFKGHIETVAKRNSNASQFRFNAKSSLRLRFFSGAFWSCSHSIWVKLWITAKYYTSKLCLRGEMLVEMTGLTLYYSIKGIAPLKHFCLRLSMKKPSFFSATIVYLALAHWTDSVRQIVFYFPSMLGKSLWSWKKPIREKFVILWKYIYPWS